jgi:hypothetical protein
MALIENDASNNSYIVAYVFFTAVTFLRSRYLTTIGGYSHTDWWEVFMQYAIEMSVYVPSFIKIGSAIQKLIGGYIDSMVIT